jgi:hypothetical protein
VYSAGRKHKSSGEDEQLRVMASQMNNGKPTGLQMHWSLRSMNKDGYEKGQIALPPNGTLQSELHSN